MGGADVVVLEFPREHVGARHTVDVARAQTVVAVDDAFAEELRDGSGGGMLAVDGTQDVGALLDLGDGLTLELLNVESGTVDACVVEDDEVAIVAHGEFLDSVFVGKPLVDVLHDAAGIPASGWEVVALHVVRVVGSAMVGREEEEIASAADAAVEECEEVGEVAVELLIGGDGLCTACAILVGDGIGVGDADAEHVGDFAGAELLVLEQSLSHLEGERDALGLHLLVFAGLGGIALVELAHPAGQLLHVVGGGDEMADAVVVPVGGIGCMAGGEDGGTVLHGNAEDARLEVVAQAQLVADGVAEHVAWRAESGTGVAAYALYVVVAAAVGPGAEGVVVEVVAADAVEGWRGTGVDAGVADGGDGGHVVDHAVLAGVAFVDEAFQSAVDKVLIVIVEVVPTHLVDDKSDDELRALYFLTCPDGCRHEHER